MNFSEDDYKIAMVKLYTARWNIPQAASFLGLSSKEENWELIKEIFSDYMRKMADPIDSDRTLRG